MDKENEKIRFKNLSWVLKVAVVTAWIELCYLAFIFMIGFVLGLTGGI